MPPLTLENLTNASTSVLADYLGVSARTVRRYKSGSLPLPEPSRRLLALRLHSNSAALLDEILGKNAADQSGNFPVTDADIEVWLKHAGQVFYSTDRKDYYIRWWNVRGKIMAAKQDGKWLDVIRASEARRQPV